MFDMRLRIPELMAEKGWTTAYQLAKASKGQMSATNAYNLVEKRGEVASVSMPMLETLCEIFGVEPGDLLQRDRPKRR